MDYLFLSLTFMVSALLIIVWRNRGKGFSPVPPGPPRLPVIGNLFNAPAEFAWKTYYEWSKEYGSKLLYMNVLGTDIIILNSLEMATDLLDKRSRIYSGRPRSYTLSYLIKCDWMLPCLPYNDAWRTSRRLLAKYFFRSMKGSRTRTSVIGFMDFEWQQPHVVKYTRIFLRSLLQKPDLFLDHCFRLAASVSVSSTYGLDVTSEQDEHVQLAQKAGDALKVALVPGRFLIDVFPFLRLAPEWVPFKQLAKSWRDDIHRFLVIPFTHAKENLNQQNLITKLPSLLSQELDDKEVDYSNPSNERILQENSATVYIAGTSTTSVALHVFFLAMARYPEAQKRAQAEVHTLLTKKGQQLPTHDDLEDLPFCMAVVYEVLRWHVAGPIGLPHLSTEEDVYLGYRIPKDSVIIPNVWAMMQDPTKFKDPLEFKPERFLSTKGRLDKSAVKNIDPVFGFGRRVCVGRSLALSIIAHAVCCVLAVFDVGKKVDERGEAIEPRVEFESNITSFPLPFVCSIKPRTAEAEEMIKELII